MQKKQPKTYTSTSMFLKVGEGTISLFFGVLLLTVLIGMPNTASAKSTNGISLVPNVLLAFTSLPSSRSAGNSRPLGPGNGPTTNNPTIPPPPPTVIPIINYTKSISFSSTSPSNLLLTYYSTAQEWNLVYLNFGITVNRRALSQKNGTTIADKATISVGDTLSFTAPRANTDISWSGSSNFTTSSASNGYWISNAASPGPCSLISPFSLCGDGLLSYNISLNSSGFWSSIASYREKLSINPSAVTYTHINKTKNPAKLSCNSTGSSCTVTSPGSVKTQVNYSATYGKFYYYNATFTPPFYDNVSVSSVGSVPLKACPVLFKSNNSWQCTGGLDYTLNVPAQQITFTFTAVRTGTPPNPPTITGPTSANVGTPQTFSFTATDTNPTPNKIRYDIDWNADGTTDQYVPATGLVSSGTTRSTSHTLPSTGSSYTFKARAENETGATSTWTTYTLPLTQSINGSCGPANGVSSSNAPVSGLCTTGTASPISGTGPWTWTCSGINGGASSPTCSAPLSPPPVVTFTTASTTIASAGSTTLNWSSPDATSCAGSGFSTGGNTSGSVSVTPPQTTNYGITCNNSGVSTTTRYTNITVINPFITSFTVSPDRVSSGGSTTVAWATTDMKSCIITDPNSIILNIGSNTVNSGSAPISNITTQTTYTLSCTNAAEKPIPPQSVTVNVAPVIQSF